MAAINYIEKHLKTHQVNIHKHNYWEIIYVTEGNGQIETFDQNPLRYSQGDILCIPPNLYHKNFSQAGFKNIHLTIENWNNSCKQLIRLPRGEHSKDLFLLLELAYKYFHLLPVNSDLNFALSDAIIAHIEFMLDKPHLSSISQAFETAIVNNYTNIYFTLDEVYRSIPYSKEYSRKIFLKEHGVTPAKFLLQKRLALAAQLLSARSDSKNRIADIAESCGFADPLYFSRIFKHEMKVSPKEYMITALEQNKVY